MKCGGCKACCTVNAIVELEKPMRTHCPNECPKGCSIYQDRPQSCREFTCLWRTGLGRDWERPDKIGLFVEEREGEPLGVQYFAKEVRHGAARSRRGRKYLEWLSAETGKPVFVLDRTLQGVVAVVR